MFKSNDVKATAASMAQQQQQQVLQRQPKTSPITDDFEISNTVLGLGINGKVVQCSNRQTGHIYALKVSQFVIFAFIHDILRSLSNYPAIIHDVLSITEIIIHNFISAPIIRLIVVSFLFNFVLIW